MAYDFDLYVIGAGSGGVRAARFAAGFGAKVAVAESRYLGGTLRQRRLRAEKAVGVRRAFCRRFRASQRLRLVAGRGEF